MRIATRAGRRRAARLRGPALQEGILYTVLGFLDERDDASVARICKDTRLARVVHAVVRQRAWSRRRTMLLLRELAASCRVVHVSHAGCNRSS